MCIRDSNASAAHSDTRAASLTTVIQLVMAGFGATLVPLSAVATECDRPGLGLATFAEGAEAHRTVGIAYRASSTRGEEFAALGEMIAHVYAAAVEDSTAVLAK